MALMLLAVLAVAGAMVGGEALQRRFFPPGILMGGPLYGGALFFVPCLAVVLYLLVATSLIRQRTGEYRSLQVGGALLSGVTGLVTGVVVLWCAIVFLLGVRTFWIGTPDGVTVHAPWLWRPVSYAWGDVTSRSMYCYHSKNGSGAAFEVRFKDGRTINMAAWIPHSELQAKLPVLLSLTDGVAHSTVGSLNDCPGRLAEIFAGQGGR